MRVRDVDFGGPGQLGANQERAGGAGRAGECGARGRRGWAVQGQGGLGRETGVCTRELVLMFGGGVVRVGCPLRTSERVTKGGHGGRQSGWKKWGGLSQAVVCSVQYAVCGVRRAACGLAGWVAVERSSVTGGGSRQPWLWAVGCGCGRGTQSASKDGMGWD